MRKIRIVVVAAALTVAVPATAQQPDAPKQSLSAKIKQRYLERRTKFMLRMKAATAIKRAAAEAAKQ
jgi:hypothetical protein